MRLDRRELRDDLAAVIAAGRELSPEHDYALAEVFIERVRENLRRELSPPSPPVKRRGIGPLLAAGCLGLAALSVPFVAVHTNHARVVYTQPDQQVLPFVAVRAHRVRAVYPQRDPQLVPKPNVP